MPLAALGAGLAVIGWGIRDTASVGAAILPALAGLVPATLAAVLTYAALTVVGVRLLAARPARGVSPGAQPLGLAAVGHRTADGRRAQLPVPALRRAC